MIYVGDIMTEVVRTIPKHITLSEVEGIFVAEGLSGAPLVDNDATVVGFISKSDINRFDFTGGDPAYTQAWEVANPRLICINKRVPVRDAAELMLKEHVHHLIVVDGDRMAGIVSSMDMVSLVASLDL